MMGALIDAYEGIAKYIIAKSKEPVRDAAKAVGTHGLAALLGAVTVASLGIIWASKKELLSPPPLQIKLTS